MPRFQYKEGYLFCNRCGKHYKIEDCPLHKSRIQTYRICPMCPQKWKVRSGSHNRNNYKYYREVMKPLMQEESRMLQVIKEQERRNA